MVLAVACVVWNRGRGGRGIQMQASLSFHWGDLLLWISTEKISVAFPWRRTDKVALKRMGWVALEELDNDLLDPDYEPEDEIGVRKAIIFEEAIEEFMIYIR